MQRSFASTKILQFLVLNQRYPKALSFDFIPRVWSIVMTVSARAAEVEWIAPAELRNPDIRSGYAYWDSLRGGNKWPSRHDLDLRELGSAATYMALLKVIDGGNDFEHRITGNAVVQAFNVAIQRRRFSEIADQAPHLIAHSLPIFRRVVQDGAPLAWRQRNGLDASPEIYTDSEVVLLPLGESEVDHVLGFAVHSSNLHAD